MTVKRTPEYAHMLEALGYGMLNLGLFTEAKAKDRFQDIGGPLPRPASSPGAGPVVQTGNLRRGIHTVAFANGKRLGSSELKLPPEVASISGIGTVVGTNTGYGGYVELGTSRMAARPYLLPAGKEAQAQAGALIGQGARRHFGSGPS